MGTTTSIEGKRCYSMKTLIIIVVSTVTVSIGILILILYAFVNIKPSVKAPPGACPNTIVGSWYLEDTTQAHVILTIGLCSENTEDYPMCGTIIATLTSGNLPSAYCSDCLLRFEYVDGICNLILSSKCLTDTYKKWSIDDPLVWTWNDSEQTIITKRGNIFKPDPNFDVIADGNIGKTSGDICYGTNVLKSNCPYTWELCPDKLAFGKCYKGNEKDCECTKTSFSDIQKTWGKRFLPI